MEREADNGAEGSRRAAWHWLTPSLTHWLWLMLFLTLCVEPQRTKLVSGDGDASMHWRLGEHMLTTHEILRADVFSHTRYGDRYISKEWLSEIIYAVAGRLRGLSGLSITAALVLATMFALLHRQLLREGADPVVGTMVVLVAVWATVPHWHARPHILSFPMLLWWNQALRHHEKQGGMLRLAAALAGLTLVWVNLHGSYLAGFIVLGCYWLGALWETARASEPASRADARRKLASLSGAALLCGLVSLANPNGWLVHIHNLSFVRSKFFVNWIDEYSSVDFHLAGASGFLAWLALLAYALLVRQTRIPAGPAILVTAWCYFALYAERNVEVLVIVTAPMIAPLISESLKSNGWSFWDNLVLRVRRIHDMSRGWPVVTAVAIGLIVIHPLPVQMPAARWPVQAIQHIKAHPERFQGKLFNAPLWGSYLLLALPEHKVFADSRFDFYEEGVMRDFDEVLRVGPSCLQVLDKYDIQWTLLRNSYPIHQVLKLSADWQLEYSDATATVYRRKPRMNP